ncbi:hypothetical protein KL86DYS1_30624 [uncultured Dysgonomonas sp.]|uniref:Uncharacterized protein n=1 Tax=uncultured Dysgonomonas sp. TaxID=206096 RepID=A0A212JVX9_9BACT|nr:hypothetical protein KL86DYS1_30624 [uncultured Dysgonomonas sp.]
MKHTNRVLIIISIFISHLNVLLDVLVIYYKYKVIVNVEIKYNKLPPIRFSLNLSGQLLSNLNN